MLPCSVESYETVQADGSLRVDLETWQPRLSVRFSWPIGQCSFATAPLAGDRHTTLLAVSDDGGVQSALFRLNGGERKQGGQTHTEQKDLTHVLPHHAAAT